MSEIIVMFTATAAGLGQPLTAIQLLWINLVSDIFPGMALALEPPEPDVLTRPPRDPDEPLLGGQDFKRITREAVVLSAGAMGAYAYGAMRYGRGPQAGSLTFMTLTLGQILHALHCRSAHQSFLFPGGAGRPGLGPNPYLRWAVGGTLALQAAALVVPPLRSLLGVVPLGVADAAVVGLGSVGPLLLNETLKGTGAKR